MRNLLLRASMVDMQADADPSKRWIADWIEVLDPENRMSIDSFRYLSDRCEPAYRFMCDAILTSVELADGSNPSALQAIRRIEAGELDSIETVGNGWITRLSRAGVWFEGLHEQGIGGEVTLAQYKLAVQTYIRFLADPKRKTVEVPFPENSKGTQ